MLCSTIILNNTTRWKKFACCTQHQRGAVSSRHTRDSRKVNKEMLTP